MDASELRKTANAVPSNKKRAAMRYAELINLDKFYTHLTRIACRGKYSAICYVMSLVEDEYIKPSEEFDTDYFLKLFANRLESNIEGIKTSINGEALTIDWS